MKILWITNQPVPELAKKLGISVSNGGGWMNKLADQIAVNNELGIAFPKRGKDLIEIETGNIVGFAFPAKKRATTPDHRTVAKLEIIISEFKPDIIHIWGTEYVHSYCAVKACEELKETEKVLISIQGMVSIYAKHFYASISPGKLLFPTAHDIRRGSSVRHQYKDFIKRGKYEIKAIQNIRHVIGRTDWDKACTTQINPKINYHFCNETLRSSFYDSKWCLEKCEKHSIFVSQSQYPIKGFHLLLEALPLLLKKWPDCKVYTTGRIYQGNCINDWEKMCNYDGYICKTIKKLNLKDHVYSTGTLSEKEMKERYLKSHVFVSPSSIENSPNSVGEAMILGMPVVASDVGGVTNMMQHEVEGFIYQYDAPYMLAYYIDKIFSDDEVAVSLGMNARKRALVTHNPEINHRTMIGIYSTIKSETIEKMD